MSRFARHLACRRASQFWPAVAAAGLSLALTAGQAAAQSTSQGTVRAAPRARHADHRTADQAVMVQQGSNQQPLSLETGSGRLLTLSGPAANVFVADPKVAEVRPASTNSLFVFGVAAGRTTIAALDADGHPIAQFDVTVRPNTFAAGEAQAAVKRLLPNSNVHVLPEARGLLLTGTVPSAADAARVVNVMQGFVAGDQRIENQLAVQSSIQVNLRVRVIEMSRSVTRALGVDWQALGSIGRIATAFSTTTGLGAVAGAAGMLKVGTPDVNAIISALANDNLVRILAEPNLTVLSGQAGSFLAGGEFPVPVGQQNGAVTVEFKRYGVTLGVVPTVLSDGRINLHINPEVSQLSTQGAVTLTAANSTFSVPAVTVRRAETTVELGSGQSFAIAGLLQDQSTQATTGLPFLGDLPVIGALFRSGSFQKQETELVIIVTPYIVKPVSDPATLHTPDESYSPPNDLERILLLQQNGAHGAMRESVAARIPGDAGFIVQ